MASPSDHKATIIDGKAVAQTIRSEIAEEVRQLSQKYGKVLYLPYYISINYLVLIYHRVNHFISIIRFLG